MQQPHAYNHRLYKLTMDSFRNSQLLFCRFVPFSVVHSISESWSVHDGELEFDAFLFYIHRVFGDFDRLRDSLCKQDKRQSLFLGYGREKQTYAGPNAAAASPSALSSFLSLYRSVRKRLLTRVDFPRPDSPSEQEHQSGKVWEESQKVSLVPMSRGFVPATMSVKSKPFLTDLRCTWLGSVAKPTYSLSWSCKGNKSETGHV